jgi:hypothetical protein
MPIQPERAGLRAPIALVDNATADDGADDGIDEMEGALLAAHASRLKPKKRLIAEVDEDDVDEEDGDGEDEAPSAGPKKRPASAAGALKRPAGAVKRPAAAVAAFKIGKGIKLGAGKIDMSDIFAKMVDDYKAVGLTRNAFTSRAYSHGRKRMLLSGASDKAAIEFARTMLTKASELWESL